MVLTDGTFSRTHGLPEHVTPFTLLGGPASTAGSANVVCKRAAGQTSYVAGKIHSVLTCCSDQFPRGSKHTTGLWPRQRCRGSARDHTGETRPGDTAVRSAHPSASSSRRQVAAEK